MSLEEVGLGRIKTGQTEYYKKGLVPTAPATQALRSPLPYGRQMRRSKIGPTLYCKYRDWASLTLAFVEVLRFVWRDS
ncbi:hypothetical protein A4R26_32800 [Niastella populi]|uniref:Uncharacterized protein n=1 Tax=Niastella populi TaxID=550983 RepID=A0A1V9GAW8_9BACT|nr:hypothetical protein A4R26_32800 [Niastella populi]